MDENKKDIQLDEKTIKRIKDLGANSLFFLSRAILEFKDFEPHIHKPICDELQQFKKNKKIAIVLPRDWFKSTIGSVAYPIWRAINDPNIRILVVQNSFSNACKKLNAIKQIFEKNSLFRALYPEILPQTGSRWSQECLTVNRTAAHPEGTFEAAGTGTAVTSRHYDLIIEDDTVAPEKDAMKGVVQQPTQLEIEKAIGWHRIAMPLQIHPIDSQRVVIGTRWAEADLLGWIKDKEPQYLFLERKAREHDLPVWERFNEEVLQQLESASGVGPFMFAALYMNDPMSAINQIFKRDWVQYYDTIGQKESSSLVYCTSVDPAPAEMGDSSDPDYNIILTTGIHPPSGRVYVAEITRDHMDPGELIDHIIAHNVRWHSVVTKIEAIAYQRTISYWLKRQKQILGKQFYVEEVRTHGKISKMARIRALQPYFADGLIYIRPHMSQLERELYAFPRGAHDDILDALAMQIPFWNQETKMFKEEKEKVLAEDPLSGSSVIDNILGRANEGKQYPYDIGHMKERLHPLRDYQYN